MNRQDLIKEFKDNNGWLKSKDFSYKSNVYSYLKKMIQEGSVQHVKKGLYFYSADALQDEMQEVAKRYPKGVFCLLSALFHYNLTTSIPHCYHLAFPHKTKIKIATYPPVQPYYWSEKYYTLGLVKVNDISIYNVEKSVCDAVKFRNKIGEEITFEVLKNYMFQKERNIEKLMKYAKQMRIANIINPMLKPLL